MLCRLQLRAVVALVALLVLAGTALRVSSLSPDGLLSLELYGSLFTLHDIAGLIAAPAFAVFCLVSFQRADWISGIAVFGIYGGLIAVLGGAPAQVITAFVSVGYVAAGASLARAAGSWVGFTFASWGLAGASVGLFVASSALLLGWPGPLESLVQALSACAVVLGTEAAARRPTSRFVMGIYALAFAVSTVAPANVGLVSGLVLPMASVALAGSAWRAASAKQPWTRGLLRIAALLFGQAAVLRGILSAFEPAHPLHHTLFPAGVHHAEWFALTSAVLSLPGRVPNRPGSVRGPLLFGVGAHVMCWSFVELGRRGMPARFVSYLPEFQPMQILITLASLTTVAGLAWIGITYTSMETTLDTER